MVEFILKLVDLRCGLRTNVLQQVYNRKLFNYLQHQFFDICAFHINTFGKMLKYEH